MFCFLLFQSCYVRSRALSAPAPSYHRIKKNEIGRIFHHPDCGFCGECGYLSSIFDESGAIAVELLIFPGLFRYPLFQLCKLENPQGFQACSVENSVDNVDNLQSQEPFSHFYYVSGAHSYQQITVDTIFQKKCFNLIKAGEIMDICPQCTDFLRQYLRADA